MPLIGREYTLAVFIPDSAILVATDDLLSTEFSREFVILNLKDGVYYGLEEVGARVWELLQSPVTVRAICDAISAEYDVASARCERDTRSLVDDLVSRGLVTVRESS
jgi:hypothetical protein